MEIDYDYLRTGTAIGFLASRELCSNYLLLLSAVATTILFYSIVTKFFLCFSFIDWRRPCSGPRTWVHRYF